MKVRPGDMRYRQNPEVGTSEIVAIFVQRLRSNQKNSTRPHQLPEQNQSPGPGLVKHPSSTAADVADQPSQKPLPNQFVPEKTPVGIALSRPRRTIRPPTRLIEQI